MTLCLRSSKMSKTVPSKSRWWLFKTKMKDYLSFDCLPRLLRPKSLTFVSAQVSLSTQQYFVGSYECNSEKDRSPNSTGIYNFLSCTTLLVIDFFLDVWRFFIFHDTKLKPLRTTESTESCDNVQLSCIIRIRDQIRQLEHVQKRFGSVRATSNTIHEYSVLKPWTRVKPL